MPDAATTKTTTNATPDRVTGVELMRGIGHRPAKGFWADAWDYVVRRPSAIIGLLWIGIIAFFACFSPFIANGHPYILREYDAAGTLVRTSYPLFRFLSIGDILLPIGAVAAAVWMLVPWGPGRSKRLLAIVEAALAGGLIAIVASVWNDMDWRVIIGVGLAVYVAVALPSLLRGRWVRAGVVALAIIGSTSVSAYFLKERPGGLIETFDYAHVRKSERYAAVFAPLPWSPNQRDTSREFLSPTITQGEAMGEIRTLKERRADPERAAALAKGEPSFPLGTDSLGQDVLSQLFHACRLSISIGLVSTGIAVFIGVTLGALMGYFGGWVDTVLFRVVEIVQSIPVLFLLIVAAGVLPPEFRTTYVTMAIIGCFTWTSAARFIRAEFFKLRNQDFVQSAKAAGLPLRSVLFKHMLPNGVTPVLVDASFAIAVAIQFEAILSYLGLGPVDQASWGRLLSDATSQAGTFIPAIAMSAGAAIFATVLSLTLIGEAMRDAIDPKLKKARV